MPTVPRISIPQVQEAPLPNVRQTAQPQAAALGGGAATAGAFDAVENSFLKIKQNADQVALLDAQNRLAEWENKKLYDPKEGLLNRQGKDALGIGDEIQTDYEKHTNEIQSSLSGRQQQEAFARLKADRFNDINKVVQRHTANEMDKYDDEQTQKGIALEYDNALKNFGDEAAVMKSINRQSQILFQYGQRKGKSQEWYDEESSKYISKTQSGVISSILNSKSAMADIAAKQYFDKHKESFSGEDRAVIEKKLQEATQLGSAQRNADAIFSKYQSSPTSAYDEAKKIKDPEIRQATEKQLDIQFNRYKEYGRMGNESRYNDAWNKVYQAGNVDVLGDAFYSLKPSEKENLLEVAAKRSKGESFRTDPEVFNKLRTIAVNKDSQDEFKKINLGQYRNSLSDSDFMELGKIQGELRKGDSRSDIYQYLSSSKAEMNMVDSLLKATDLNNDDAKYNFQLQLNDRKSAYKKRNGREPDMKEVESLANDLLTDSFVQAKDEGFLSLLGRNIAKTFTGVEYKAGKTAVKKKLFEVTVDDLTKDQINEITNKLTRAGFSPSDENVLEYYRRSISKGKK